MNYTEKLNALINEHNGIILTKYVTQAGIPRTYIGRIFLVWPIIWTPCRNVPLHQVGLAA